MGLAWLIGNRPFFNFSISFREEGKKLKIFLWFFLVCCRNYVRQERGEEALVLQLDKFSSDSSHPKSEPNPIY